MGKQENGALSKWGLDAMAHRLDGSGLDPAICIRVFEPLKILTDALDRSAANHSYAATDNLREAADGAMRAIARLMLELHAAEHINPARACRARKIHARKKGASPVRAG